MPHPNPLARLRNSPNAVTLRSATASAVTYCDAVRLSVSPRGPLAWSRFVVIDGMVLPRLLGWFGRCDRAVAGLVRSLARVACSRSGVWWRGRGCVWRGWRCSHTIAVMDDDAYATELADIRQQILDGSITDAELTARMNRLENRVTLAELQALCGPDGGLRFDDGTVMACRADGSVVRVLRGPDGPPLLIG